MAEVTEEELKKLNNGLKPTDDDVLNYLISKDGTWVQSPQDGSDKKLADLKGTINCGKHPDPYGKMREVTMDYEIHVAVKYKAIKEPF